MAFLPGKDIHFLYLLVRKQVDQVVGLEVVHGLMGRQQ